MNGSKEMTNPLRNPWLEKIKIKELSDLSYEESAVLDEIRKIAVNIGVSYIKILVTEAQVMPNGMIIRTTGFYNIGGNYDNDFLLDSSTLKRMAADHPFKTIKMKEFHKEISDYFIHKSKTISESQQPTNNKSEYDTWRLCREQRKYVYQGLYKKTVQSALERYDL